MSDLLRKCVVLGYQGSKQQLYPFKPTARCVQSAALFFVVCWLFTNIVVLNLVIALVLEQFRLRDAAKLAVQRKEVLNAIRVATVIDSVTRLSFVLRK